MAQIIKPGLPQKWLVGQEVECPGCFTVFLVEETDQTWEKAQADNTLVAFVRCPRCLVDKPFKPTPDMVPQENPDA